MLACPSAVVAEYKELAGESLQFVPICEVLHRECVFCPFRDLYTLWWFDFCYWRGVGELVDSVEYGNEDQYRELPVVVAVNGDLVFLRPLLRHPHTGGLCNISMVEEW